MIYDDLIEFRDESVSGVSGWWWVKTDHGAWDGPKKDWEDHHSQKYFTKCRDFRTAVCAGGNCGMYPKLLNNKFNVVYAFEPDPLNFYCMTRNCNSDRTIKLQIALGDKAGIANVKRHSMDNVGTHSIEENSKGITLILPLDSFHFETLDFIQLDVEGYEARVLQGAINTITKHKPVITAELGNKAEVVDIMTRLNYTKLCDSVSDVVYIPNL